MRRRLSRPSVSLVFEAALLWHFTCSLKSRDSHVLSTPPQPASTTTLPVFSARNLTKVYEMGEVRVEALRGVDFDLAAGEFVVLLGPSGSGKSTLLNILGGLDVPTSGEVVYAGQNLTTADEAALTAYRRTHIGFVFQFYNLIPSLTARENVALVTEISRNPMKPEDALALVGLAHRLDAGRSVLGPLGTRGGALPPTPSA